MNTITSRDNGSRVTYRFLFCAFLGLGAGSALSAEPDQLLYTLRGGLSYSDNVEREPSGDEHSATSAVAGLELHGSRPTGRLRYDIATDVSHYDYLGSNDFDPQTTGNASIKGAYDILPDSFTWNGGLSYDQIREDILRPLAPGNSEARTSLSTGPTLRMRFSGAMEATLDGHYTRLGYSDSPFDNETLGTRIQLARRSTPRSLLALGASYDDVSYLSKSIPTDLDYHRREAFARLEAHGVRTNVQLETGYTNVVGKTVDEGGILLRASVDRRLTPALTGFIHANREYSTSDMTAASFDPALPGGGSYDNSQLSAGPRLMQNLEGGLRFERPRTQAEAAYMVHKEDAQATGAGVRRFNEWRGSVTRLLRPGLQGSIYGALTHESFTISPESFDERILGGTLGVSFGRSLGLDLRMEYRNRDGITVADHYSELSGGVFLRYGGRLGAGAAQ